MRVQPAASSDDSHLNATLSDIVLSRRRVPPEGSMIENAQRWPTLPSHSTWQPCGDCGQHSAQRALTRTGHGGSEFHGAWQRRHPQCFAEVLTRTGHGGIDARRAWQRG
eukprot:359322-Chlamydomonas_euryale.AAC.1